MLLEAPGRPLRPAELLRPKPRLIPGHEIVGKVVSRGAGVDRFAPGQRVGIPRLGHTCGVCRQ